MKSLADTLMEKLDIKSVNLDEFPIDGTIDEMGEFLNKNKFEKIEKYKIGFGFSTVSNQNNRCYLISYPHTWIKFGDMSKPVSKKNPIFCIVKEHNQDEFFAEYTYKDYKMYNKEEFLDLINETLKF